MSSPQEIYIDNDEPPEEYPAGKKGGHGWIWAIAIIALVLVVLGILFLTWTASKASQGSQAITPTPACASLNSTLPNISTVNTNQQCCIAAGTSTPGNTLYYQTLNLIIGPTAQPWASVCGQFCDGTFDPSSGNCSYFDASTNPNGQTNLTACIAKMQPSNCSGPAMPVANVNGVPYYGQAASLKGCPNGQGTCPVS